MMQAVSWAYHCFSLLLMVIYDPSVPRIGPGYLEGQKLLKVLYFKQDKYLFAS